MIGHRRGPEAMVERVLPQRALRPIDRGEDVVHQQIAPGPVVERSAVVRGRDPGAVRRGHGVHAAGPLDRHAPGGAKPGEAFGARVPQRRHREPR